MQFYYSIEDKEHFQATGLIKISLAWLMGAFAIWLYANESILVHEYFAAFLMYLGITKLFGLAGWMDFSRSRGFSRFWGLLSFLPIAGAIVLAFLPDRWYDQQVPKIEIKKLSW